MILDGVRVLDFGRFIAGPYCAALLADYGADVVRIERVDGGEDRSVPRLAKTGEGGLYLQMNRNKRCLTLDLASDEGRDIVRALVRTADVVVANLPPETLAGLGLDYASVSALNPRTILVHATAYGRGGPYSARVGFDSVGQAMSGAMFMSGMPDAPSRAAVNYVDFGTAQACAMGVFAALLAREKTGRGQLVEASLLRTGLIHNNALLIEQAVTRRNRIPRGNRGHAAAPVDTYRTRTGWIVVQTVGDAMFRRWCRLTGRIDLIDDPRMQADESRGDHSEEVSAAMAAWCAPLDRDDALEKLGAAKIPAAAVHSLQEALDDPHVRATNLLKPMRFPGLDTEFPLAPHPVDLSDTPPIAPRPAPRLGEHTDEILAELGYSAERIGELRRRGLI